MPYTEHIYPLEWSEHFWQAKGTTYINLRFIEAYSNLCRYFYILVGDEVRANQKE